MNKNYNDIINLPHFESKKHPRMSLEARSAQFAPFAALTGYEDAVKEHGTVVKVKSKFGETLIANPAVKMQRDALKDVTAIAARFGFSPVDRAKLKLEVKEEDPLAEFMKEFSGKEE